MYICAQDPAGLEQSHATGREPENNFQGPQGPERDCQGHTLLQSLRNPEACKKGSDCDRTRGTTDCKGHRKCTESHREATLQATNRDSFIHGEPPCESCRGRDRHQLCEVLSQCTQGKQARCPSVLRSSRLSPLTIILSPPPLTFNHLLHVSYHGIQDRRRRSGACLQSSAFGR